MPTGSFASIVTSVPSGRSSPVGRLMAPFLTVAVKLMPPIMPVITHHGNCRQATFFLLRHEAEEDAEGRRVLPGVRAPHCSTTDGVWRVSKSREKLQSYPLLPRSQLRGRIHFASSARTADVRCPDARSSACSAGGSPAPASRAVRQRAINSLRRCCCPALKNSSAMWL